MNPWHIGRDRRENVPDAMDNGGQGPPSLEQICSRVAGGAEHGGAAAAADEGEVGWVCVFVKQ